MLDRIFDWLKLFLYRFFFLCQYFRHIYALMGIGLMAYTQNILDV